MFVDIITAFAVLLRRTIVNESDADELWLRRLSCSGFSQEDIDVIYGVITDHSWLIAHDSLPYEQSKNTFLAQLSSCYYRNTWFSQQSLPNVVHTTRGSMAGMPLADIIYALASSRVLGKFHCALISEGLTSSIADRDNLPLQLLEVTYCDDTAVPVISDALGLVDKASLVTEVAVTVFMSFGLHVSFDNGKTEAVAYFCGFGSTIAQRALAAVGSCSMFSFLGVSYTLNFVKSYKHLGSHFSVSNELRLEIVSKAGYIKSGIGAITPILKHPKVELKKKLTMVKSHLLGGGLYQCGTWGYISLRMCMDAFFILSCMLIVLPLTTNLMLNVLIV